MAAQLIARKRGLAAAAVLVDGPGHQFLARAALAQDQHGHVLRGDAADRLVELLHGRRAAHQLVALDLRRAVLVVHGRRAADLADVDGPRHHVAKLVQVQRLEQVLEGPQLHGLDGGLGGPVRRDDDHRQPGVDLADLAVGVQSRHVGQPDVEDHGVGRLAADLLRGLRGRCRP